jgi:hypothetical protein
MEGVLRDLRCLCDLGDRLSLRQHAIGLAQLAHDLLRRVTSLLRSVLLSPILQGQ